jgi:serine/threonine protein kinase
MLDHRNVTKLLEVFENRKFILFVMEYAEEGDILKLLK